MTQFQKIFFVVIFSAGFFSSPRCPAAEEVSYGVGSWKHVLGNHRAIIEVAKPSDAVWAHIPWRRRDLEPADKDIVVVDLRTGKYVRNLARVNINREFGDIVFQPATAPGKYAVYYYPLERIVGRPTGTCDFRYRKPYNAADKLWLDRYGLGESRYLESNFKSQFSVAKLVRIEARSEFDRFYPMEIVATDEEIERLKNYYPDQSFLLFPESRKFPIRMTDDLPLRWIRKGPSNIFRGKADRNEFYTFQIGVYAIGQTLRNLSVKFGDLKNGTGGVIPSSAFCCFNLSGTGGLGKPLTKTVSVQEGKVQAMWFGVRIPKDAQAGVYQGAVLIGPASGKKASVKLILRVAKTILADGGVGDLWRYSRLQWLNSTAGLEDTVTRPYTPMKVDGRRVICLGKRVTFSDTGLPESIRSQGNEILAGPVKFIIETAGGPVTWHGTRAKVVKATDTKVIWESKSYNSIFRRETKVRMEFDGYAFYQVKVIPLRDVDVKDIRLEIPYRKQFATYMMGLDMGPGGYRPKQLKWKWEMHPNNKVWLGDVEGGLRCKLRGPASLEDIWAEYKPEVTGIPKSWGNNGKGGCTVTDSATDTVLFRAYSGARHLKAGRELSFNFSLLITPVKPRDPKHWCNPKQWNWRYSMLTKSPEIAKLFGANIVTAFHSSPQNPWINYPFLTSKKRRKWIERVHKLGMKAKIYYTIGELSNHAVELWPLRSLGNEIFASGKGGGGEWLQEHLIDNYQPRWYCHPYGMESPADASIYLTGMNRWFNYYVESIRWLAKTEHIDGMYYDGARFSRRIMQRIRRVIDKARPGCLLDYHAGNNITRRSNTFNDAMEHLPYLDSTWIGEGFNYNYGPDFYMTELSGIPFGVPNNMLEGGGNPWRGMVYGMATRYIENHAGSPTTLWRFWDKFGIAQTRMIGYWDKTCPVKTNNKNVLATVYRKRGKVLISIASWAKKNVLVRLKIDWKRMGVNRSKARIYAPPIPEFQNGRSFAIDQKIPVTTGRGWLLIVDEGTNKEAFAPIVPPAGQILFNDNFSGDKLSAGWRQKTKGTDSRSKITPAGLVISSPSESELYLERTLPRGTEEVSCCLRFPLKTPLGRRQRLAGLQSPGLSVIWPTGTVRVSFAGKGAFTIDDEVMDHMYRFVPSLMKRKGSGWVYLRIWWDTQYVYVDASPNGRKWETLRAIPRALFPSSPTAMRIGKMGKDYGWPRTVRLTGRGKRQKATYRYIRISGKSF